MQNQRHLFVDGGVTPYNNPALIAFLMATIPSYHIVWSTGVNQLQIVSVGTGSVRTKLAKQQAEQIHLIDQLAFCDSVVVGIDCAGTGSRLPSAG